MRIIGISGGSGSGKTSILNALKESYSESEVAVISQDDYYHPVDRTVENHKVDFDRPEALDLDRLAKDIHHLLSGVTVSRMEYTFNNASESASVVLIRPAPILLVEGLFVLYHEDIRSLCHHLVYIEADAHIRFQRRLDRDMKERGYSDESIRYKWKHQVERGFKAYLEPNRSLADMLIDSNESIDKGVKDLSDLIDSTLEEMR